MNEHSAKYNKVKGYYEKGPWTAEMVHNAVNPPTGKPWITQEEAEEITAAPAEDGAGE